MRKSRARKSLKNTESEKKSARLEMSMSTKDEPVAILPDLVNGHLSVIHNKENVESDADHEVLVNTEKEIVEESTINQIANKENRVLNLKPRKGGRARKPQENLKPERKSARLANKVVRIPPNQEDDGRAKNVVDGGRLWKNFEKAQLLTGLKSHGSKEYNAVAAYVPTKTQDMVKAYVKREQRNHLFTIKTIFKQDDGTEVVIEGERSNAESQKRQVPSKDMVDGPSAKPKGRVEEKLVRKRRSNPVEQWLEVMENNDDNAVGNNSTALNYSSVLPTSLNWIANNELHPDPENCGGVDYAAIYKYLACLCQGEAPPDLNPASATRVLRLLPMVAGVVKNMDLKKEERWLENYRGVHSARSYERDPRFDAEKESVENIESLSRIPGLNPLGIDAEVCVSRPSSQASLPDSRPSSRTEDLSRPSSQNDASPSRRPSQARRLFGEYIGHTEEPHPDSPVLRTRYRRIKEDAAKATAAAEANKPELEPTKPATAKEPQVHFNIKAPKFETSFVRESKVSKVKYLLEKKEKKKSKYRGFGETSDPPKAEKPKVVKVKKVKKSKVEDPVSEVVKRKHEKLTLEEKNLMDELMNCASSEIPSSSGSLNPKSQTKEISENIVEFEEQQTLSNDNAIREDFLEFI